jgi:RNA polymerase sigma-70 factor (ECF subfamily)
MSGPAGSGREIRHGSFSHPVRAGSDILQVEPAETAVLSTIVPSFPVPLSAESSGTDADVARVEQIFHRHLDAVWRAARTLGVSPRDQEDVVQEVMLVCVRRLGDIEPERERAFLLATTAKVVANWRRGRRRRPAEPVESVDALGGPALDRALGRDGPVEALERKRELELVQSALEQMTEPQRTVFALFELEGLSAREIAEQLGTSESVVFARLSRARAVFQRHVQRARRSVRGTP